MKKYFNFSLMLLLVLMCSAPLWAQITGVVKGVVTDQNGKPIVGATVELVGTQTGTKYTLKTNSKGAFYSVGIGLGVYRATLFLTARRSIRTATW